MVRVLARIYKVLILTDYYLCRTKKENVSKSKRCLNIK